MNVLKIGFAPSAILAAVPVHAEVAVGIAGWTGFAPLTLAAGCAPLRSDRLRTDP